MIARSPSSVSWVTAMRVYDGSSWLCPTRNSSTRKEPPRSMMASQMRGSIIESMMWPLSSTVDVGTRLRGARRGAGRGDAALQAGGGGARALGRARDAAADGDEHAAAHHVETGADRLLQGSALGADAGQQEGLLRRLRAEHRDRLRRGGAHHQADRPAPVVPAQRQ